MSDLSNSGVKIYVPVNGVEEFHLTGIESWDEFELLVEFLVRRFSAKVVEVLDGICSRTWKLAVGDLNFTMKHHDDIGNYFFAVEDSRDHQRLMESIVDAMNAEFYSKTG